MFILAAVPIVGCRPSQTRDDPLEIQTNAPLTAAIAQQLNQANWTKQVGKNLGLWVSIKRQHLYGIRAGKVIFAYKCSTAARGPGNQANSYKTPTGWHEIRERYGKGLPAGAVFKERKYTGRNWSPDQPTGDDLILSRILWLSGLEPGHNAGPGIDSHARYIYIHGTPEEHKLGTPASMGCVRLSNADVIELFKQTNSGTRVLITKW